MLQHHSREERRWLKVVLLNSSWTWRHSCKAVSVPKHHSIKAYGGLEVKVHAFLTSALDVHVCLQVKWQWKLTVSKVIFCEFHDHTRVHEIVTTVYSWFSCSNYQLSTHETHWKQSLTRAHKYTIGRGRKKSFVWSFNTQHSDGQTCEVYEYGTSFSFSHEKLQTTLTLLASKSHLLCLSGNSLLSFPDITHKMKPVSVRNSTAFRSNNTRSMTYPTFR